MVQQIVNAERDQGGSVKQYIDEHVMMRVADKGDLYIHQGERSEREPSATGKAGTDACDRMATRPQGVSTKRTTGGANWNVIGVTLDTPPSRFAGRSRCDRVPCTPRRVKGNLVERYEYTPYGQLVANQGERDRGGSVNGYGDRNGDGDVDGDDKGTPGTTCTGTVTGACRILDLDFDGDYDATDAGKFDSLPQGNAAHPGQPMTGLDQPFGHQGLPLEAEVGHYQNRARQYDPGHMSYLQRDPIAEAVRRSDDTCASSSSPSSHAGCGSSALCVGPSTPQLRPDLIYLDGMNQYNYVRSSPLSALDPTGLKFFGCDPWGPWGAWPPTWNAPYQHGNPASGYTCDYCHKRTRTRICYICWFAYTDPDEQCECISQQNVPGPCAPAPPPGGAPGPAVDGGCP